MNSVQISMTPAKKRILLDLLHAAFDRAHRKGIDSPIDLVSFGNILRELEHGFSHQTYGHDNLLHLLRGEFHDLINISKNASITPPRYYVELLCKDAPLTRKPIKLLDSLLIDGDVLDHYLSRLAENSAKISSRLNSFEQRLDRFGERGGIFDLLENEFHKIKNNSDLLSKRMSYFEWNFSDNQTRLSSIEGKQRSLSDLIAVLQHKIIKFQSVEAGNKSILPASLSAKESSKKVSIAVGFPGYYVKWRFKAGDFLKANQVIAYCCPSRHDNSGYIPILAPADGFLAEHLICDGDRLSSVHSVIGYIEKN